MLPAQGSSLLPQSIFVPSPEMEVSQQQATALAQEQETPVGRRLLKSF